MKKILLPLALCLASSAAFSQVAIQFDALPLERATQVFFQEIKKTDYVLAQDVYRDKVLSMSLSSSSEDTAIKAFSNYLRLSGIPVQQVNGVTFIGFENPVTIADAPRSPWVYRPKHLNAVDLRKIVSEAFGSQSGRMALTGDSSAPAGSGTVQGMGITDKNFLTFVSTDDERKQIEQLLSQVDVVQPQLVVNAFLVDVQTDSVNQSAVQLVGSVLSGHLEFNTPSASPLSSIGLAFDGVRAILSALDSDSRFRVVSNPSILVTHQKEGRIQIGTDTPVLSEVVRGDNGQIGQSIEYRSSGVILSVLPSILEDSFSLAVTQELSDFVTTSTGVVQSPTLLKRSVSTSLHGKPGSVFLMGGLVQQTQRDSQSSFSLFPVLRSSSDDASSRELVVLLHVDHPKQVTLSTPRNGINSPQGGFMPDSGLTETESETDLRQGTDQNEVAGRTMPNNRPRGR